MKILILGAAGFIGTNIVLHLSKVPTNMLFLFGREQADFSFAEQLHSDHIKVIRGNFDTSFDFDRITKHIDIVYHLISTTYPGVSNKKISLEIEQNVVSTTKLLDACVLNHVKKVVFLSSGGTVYGKLDQVPLHESSPLYPISSYGIQKIAIEKLLYLYDYLHEIDYRIIRLANPYGPYQRPDSGLGLISTCVYKALSGGKITVFGDGSVVRDYIFIEDAVRGILKIAESDLDDEPNEKIFNLGCGRGYSINEVLQTIEQALHIPLQVEHVKGREVDVPVNVLDISRYEKHFGPLEPQSLTSGIISTAAFLQTRYHLECMPQAIYSNSKDAI